MKKGNRRAEAEEIFRKEIFWGSFGNLLEKKLFVSVQGCRFISGLLSLCSGFVVFVLQKYIHCERMNIPFFFAQNKKF